MARVFVSQQTLRKSEATGEMVQFPVLRPAERFGEIVFLLDWQEAMDLSEEESIWKIRRRLADYSDDDYLLPLGSPASMVLSALLAAEVNDGRLKILQWDRDNRTYEVKKIDVNAQPVNIRIGEM